MVKTQCKFFSCALFLMLIAGCYLQSSGELSSKEMDFYRDQFPTEDLIQAHDMPNRRASLRLVSKARSRQDVKQAIHELEDAIKLDSQNPYAYYYLSTEYSRQGEWKKADLMARRAESLFAEEPKWQGKALVLQARTQEQLNRPSQADRLYEKAKSIDPRNPFVKK